MANGILLRAVVLISLLFPILAMANSYERIGATELDRSDRYLFESKNVGDRFRVDVVLPIGYDQSDQSYPVVYVTDSNYLLVSAAATYLAQATGEYPKMIIVGIGWDVVSIRRIRIRDLTPTCNAEFKSSNAMTDKDCGQADSFSKFIGEELQPVINQKYRTSGDNTLVGYSYGGLFGLHVLFKHSDLFNRYVIGSPSMGWDSGYLFAAEQHYANNNKDLEKTVYISSGGLEGNGQIPNAYLMYEQLLARKYPSLNINLEVLDGETHMTSISAAVMRGLGSVLAEQSSELK